LSKAKETDYRRDAETQRAREKEEERFHAEIAENAEKETKSKRRNIRWGLHGLKD
jgi:hypothetical protein